MSCPSHNPKVTQVQMRYIINIFVATQVVIKLCIFRTPIPSNLKLEDLMMKFSPKDL